jgi:hypothetical protein
MNEQDTFDALRRSKFIQVFEDINNHLDNDDNIDDIHPLLKAHGWSLEDYIDTGWNKLHTEEQDDYVLEDHVRLIDQLKQMKLI